MFKTTHCLTMHHRVPDPLAADKKLLDMLPVAIIIVDDAATGYYMNPRAISIFFPQLNDSSFIPIKQFKLTQFASDFSQDQFENAKGWLEQYGCYQANLEFDISHDKACYSIKIIPYTQKDSNYRRLYLVTFEAFTATQLSANNAAIKQSFRELKQFSRLSAMREISTSMADDLNQPLTAILSYTQAMQRMYLTDADPAEMKAAMQRVVINAQHAAQIIKDIRGRTKSTELNFEFVDIHQLIQDTIALTELNSPGSSVHLTTHFDHNVPALRIIRIQIKQVLLSLLTNAMEALSTIDRDHPEIIIETALSTEELCIKISDNGPGVNEKIKDHLFEPFVTTKKDGIGIGLSMSQYIMELHHGSIILHSESKVEPGTQVSMCLPLY